MTVAQGCPYKLAITWASVIGAGGHQQIFASHNPGKWATDQKEAAGKMKEGETNNRLDNYGNYIGILDFLWLTLSNITCFSA